MIESTLLKTEPPYKQIVNVAVPRSTQWQPQTAHQLMINLFALPISVSLGIRTLPNKIQWHIETRADQTEALIDIIYGLYPQAQIIVTPKTSNYVGYFQFDVHTAAPFVAPLKMVEDFNRLDPLTTLVSALADLELDEIVVYELTLATPNQKYYDLGEKLITASTVDWWHFLHPEAAVFAATTKLTGADKVDKYVPEIQKPARVKLNSLLKQVYFEIKIQCQSEARATELIGRIFPTLAVFEQIGLNYLVAPHSKSFLPVLTAGEVAALWHLPSEQCQTPGIVWSGSAAAPVPSQLIQQEEGITLGTNIFQGKSHPVRLTYPDRIAHINLIGQTGVGKSTLLHHMVHQDIANDKGVAVIDPHGDLVDAILATSIPKGRENEVVLFDTQDYDYPIGLNLLARIPGVSERDTASYALSVMRKILADQWRSGSRMETILDAALRALVVVEGSTIRDIPRLLLDPKFRRQVLAQVTNPSDLDFWHDEYEQETPAQQRELTRPISYRTRQFYQDPTIARIVCQRGSLNFRPILDNGQIFLASLAGISDVEAETIGALLISKIQMASLSRSGVPLKQRTPFYLYVDEVQNFVTTSLDKIFSEARKYGLSLVVANQYLKQLEGDTLDSLMANVGTTIIFSLGPPDAQALVRYVKPQFTPEDLVKLDRHAAAVKMQLDGRNLDAFSIKTHNPLDRPDDAEERIARIKAQSRSAYAQHKDEVDAELMSRYEQREPVEVEEKPKENYFD